MMTAEEVFETLASRGVALRANDQGQVFADPWGEAHKGLQEALDANAGSLRSVVIEANAVIERSRQEVAR